jgi:hypothetical protein
MRGARRGHLRRVNLEKVTNRASPHVAVPLWGRLIGIAIDLISGDAETVDATGQIQS